MSKDFIDFATDLKGLVNVYAPGQFNSFFENLVLDPNVDWRYTDTLPCQDDPLPVEPEYKTLQESFGCTTDTGVTYLLQSELTKLSPEEQSLAILHERLHMDPRILALPKEKRHPEIAKIIQAMYVMIVYKEKQNRGERPTLLGREISQLQTFVNWYGKWAPVGDSPDALAANEDYEHHRARYDSDISNLIYANGEIYPAGGGLIVNSGRDVPMNSYVGIGSSFWGTLQNGKKCEPESLKDSKDDGAGNLATRNGDIYRYGKSWVTFVSNSVLLDSTVVCSEIDRSLLDNANVQFNSSITNSHIRGGTITDCRLDSVDSAGACNQSRVVVPDSFFGIDKDLVSDPTLPRPRAVFQQGTSIDDSSIICSKVESKEPEFVLKSNTAIKNLGFRTPDLTNDNEDSYSRGLFTAAGKTVSISSQGTEPLDFKYAFWTATARPMSRKVLPSMPDKAVIDSLSRLLELTEIAQP